MINQWEDWYRVEDREARVAAGVAGPVELADDGRDVGLEVAVADDDDAHPEVEHLGATGTDEELAEGHHHAAEDHGLAVAEDLVGDLAAGHRGGVDEGGVGAVDGERLVVPHQEGLGQVEDQEAAHRVVAKSLPHLGHEEDPKAGWMPALGGGVVGFALGHLASFWASVGGTTGGGATDPVAPRGSIEPAKWDARRL